MANTASSRTCSITGAAALLTAILLGGCSTTVFRHEPIWGSKRHVVSMDAKQRAVLISSDKFCSEPSPDVFSVIAQALSAGGSLSKSTDPRAVEAALQVAFSSAEQGSTIPRTQTINMLRELMFRTCERHLNGAYKDKELSIQAVRDQRLMVSILAIEQLTGAVVPKPVAISATATASQNGGSEAIVRLDDAQKELRQATKAREAAQAAFNETDGDAHLCKTVEDRAVEAAKDEDKPLTEGEKKTLDECRGATKMLNDAKDRETRALEHHGDLRRLATGLGGTTATQTSGSTAGGLDQGREIGDVVQAVKEIVGRNFTDGTEVMLFCLRNLEDTAALKAKGALANDPNQAQFVALEGMCVDHLKAVVDAQKERAEADKAESAAEKARFQQEVQAAEVQMKATANSEFDQAWPNVKKTLLDATARADLIKRIQARMEKSRRSAVSACLDAASPDERTVRDCYGKWPFPAQSVFNQEGR